MEEAVDTTFRAHSGADRHDYKTLKPYDCCRRRSMYALLWVKLRLKALRPIRPSCLRLFRIFGAVRAVPTWLTLYFHQAA